MDFFFLTQLIFSYIRLYHHTVYKLFHIYNRRDEQRFFNMFSGKRIHCKNAPMLLATTITESYTLLYKSKNSENSFLLPAEFGICNQSYDGTVVKKRFIMFCFDSISVFSVYIYYQTIHLSLPLIKILDGKDFVIFKLQQNSFLQGKHFVGKGFCFFFAMRYNYGAFAVQIGF